MGVGSGEGALYHSIDVATNVSSANSADVPESALTHNPSPTKRGRPMKPAQTSQPAQEKVALPPSQMIVAANKAINGNVTYLLGSGAWVPATTVAFETAQHFASNPLIRLPIRRKTPPIPPLSPIKAVRGRWGESGARSSKFANAHKNVVTLKELVEAGSLTFSKFPLNCFPLLVIGCLCGVPRSRVSASIISHTPLLTALDLVPLGSLVVYKSYGSHAAVIDSAGKLSLGPHCFTTLSQCVT